MSTPENHLHKLLRRKDIVRSTENLVLQKSGKLGLDPHPGAKKALLIWR